MAKISELPPLRVASGRELVPALIDGQTFVASVSSLVEPLVGAAVAAGNYFTSRDAGEMAMPAGKAFSTDDGAGNLIIYRRTEAGSIELARVLTPPALVDRIGGDEISSDPASHAAILEKLTFGGQSVADHLDAAAVERATADRAVQATGWGKDDAVDFEGLYVEGETPVREVSQIGAPKVSIGPGGALHVVSAQNSDNKALVRQVRFGEGVVRLQVRRGFDNADSVFFYAFANDALAGRAIWSDNGLDLVYGVLKSDGSTIEFGRAANKFAGAAKALVWIELSTPPVFPGLTWYIRAWADGTARPADNVAGSAVYGAVANAYPFNEGCLRPASIGAVPSRLARVQVFDGRGGTKLNSQAYLGGRWTPGFENGRLIQRTTRGGSYLRSLLTGAGGLTIDYIVVSEGAPPVFDAFVDGARFGDPILLDGPAGFAASKTVTGFAIGGTRQIELRVRGVEYDANLFFRGAGVMIEGLRPDNAAGRIAPWADERPAVLFLGDSITGGIGGRTSSASPIGYAGDVSWPVLSANAAGFRPIVNGFGGTGLTVPVLNATMPPANTAPGYPQGHAFYHMAGRPVDTVAENPAVIVINLGTNDASRGVSTDVFRDAYVAFLQKLLKSYPNVGRILAMYPFNASYKTEIFTARGLIADPRVAIVDTSLPIWSGITYTDGTHPDLAGNAFISTILAPVLRTALASPLI